MTETSIDSLLARSVVCRGLKLGLGYPAAESAQAFAASESKRALIEGALALDDGLGEAMEGLCGLDASLEARSERYESLFGHTLRGKVCPYETEYGAAHLFRQAHELADIAGYYRAFGLELSLGCEARVDHVVCELEFFEFLYRKESYALEMGDPEMREVTEKANRKFLRDHLGRFGRAFAIRLIEEDGDGFYGNLGRVLVSFLTLECRRAGLPLGPQVIELLPEEDDNLPMACGSDASPVQIDS
jgi:TorA maturation chaperone TorD